MLKKEAEQRQAVEMLCTDMLVPREHLLRKIDAAVNFARIYELVEDLYCEDNGRPSCDPVVLFKLVMIQHLFGIRSLRQTMRDAEVNVAYRWFLGYTMSQQLPHFATISYAFRHRFTAEVIEGVFRWILEEVARTGYLSPERVFADAKEKHAMRYTLYRGLAAVTAWVKLKFAAMNLKKLALHKGRPFLHFYLYLLQEATLLRCKVASLTV